MDVSIILFTYFISQTYPYQKCFPFSNVASSWLYKTSSMGLRHLDTVLSWGRQPLTLLNTAVKMTDLPWIYFLMTGATCLVGHAHQLSKIGQLVFDLLYYFVLLFYGSVESHIKTASLKSGPSSWSESYEGYKVLIWIIFNEIDPIVVFFLSVALAFYICQRFFTDNYYSPS